MQQRMILNFSSLPLETGLVNLAVLLGITSAQAQKYTQLAQTPPMGWNS